jgi:hypothetical protein
MVRSLLDLVTVSCKKYTAVKVIRVPPYCHSAMHIYLSKAPKTSTYFYLEMYIYFCFLCKLVYILNLKSLFQVRLEPSMVERYLGYALI